MVEAGAALVLGEEGKVVGPAHLASLGCHGGLRGRQEAKLPGKRVLAPARWGHKASAEGCALQPRGAHAGVLPAPGD